MKGKKIPLTSFELGKLKIAGHVREESDRAGIVAQAIRCVSGGLDTPPCIARLTIVVNGTSRSLDLIFGAMQLEAVRLEAAVPLNDHQKAKLSLDYLRIHSNDAPVTYLEGLVIVSHLDEAASFTIAKLQDPKLRQAFLLRVQDFAPYPMPDWSMKNEARWHEVIARKTVQAAINKVGRVESYRLEGP